MHRYGHRPSLRYNREEGGFVDATDHSSHRNILHRPSLSSDGTDDEEDGTSFVVWQSAGQGTGETLSTHTESPARPTRRSPAGGQGVYPDDQEQRGTQNSSATSSGRGIFGLAIAFAGQIRHVGKRPSVPSSTTSIASDFDGRSTATAMDNKSHASKYSVRSYSSEKTRKINNLSPQNSSGSNPEGRRGGVQLLRKLTSTRKGILILVLTLILVVALIVTLSASIVGKKNHAVSSAEAGEAPPELRLPPPSDHQWDSPDLTASPTLQPIQQIPTIPPVDEDQSTAAPSTSTGIENNTMYSDAPSLIPTNSPVPTPATVAPTRLRTTSAPTSRAATPVPTTEVPTPSPSPPSLAPSIIPFDVWNWTDQGEALEGNQVDQRFGQSTALSENGKTLAIGAPYSSVNGLSRAGMVQIFHWNDEKQQWSPFGLLLGRNAGDQFGSSIALSADGNVLAVSEPTYNGIAGNSSGNVRVFVNGPFNGYTPLGQDLEGDNATDQSGIGLSLSANGRRLAVGAPYHANTNENGNGNWIPANNTIVGGHAKVYEWSVEENAWAVMGSVPLQGTNHLDLFGWSVSLDDDGSLLCVGAPRNLEFGGYVRCFAEIRAEGNQTTEWRLVGDTIPNALPPIRPDDNFGTSIRTSRDPTGTRHRIAIGAPGKDTDAVDAGLVVVYEYDPSGSGPSLWTQLGGPIAAEIPAAGNQMGTSLDLRGDLLAIGSPGVNNAGQVNLYHLDSQNGTNVSNVWVIHPQSFEGIVGSIYGSSVQITAGGSLVVGSEETGGDRNSGMVNVYRLGSPA
jgi:hypothetical protein